MPTFPTHLTQPQVTQLTELVQKIVQVVSPEKIYCYGSRSATHKDWTCFWEGEGYKEATFPATYDLLVITSATDKRAEYDLVEIMEQHAEAMACDITGIVQKITAVNEALQSGSRFFTTICQKGLLLYDGSGIVLATASPEQDLATVLTEIETSWNHSFNLAKRFYKSATDCLQYNWPEQTVFNLHQAVQHTCMALLRAFTGYRSNTHNLSRLLAFTENFSFVPSTLFPRITTEEIDLFNILSKGYSDTRYNEQYHVPFYKAAILIGRVKELIVIADELYQQKLKDIKSNEQVTFPLTIITANHA